MIVLEHVNGLAHIAFEKSNRARAIDLQGKFLAIGAFGAIERTTALATNRRKNFVDGLATRGTKPFADLPTNDTSRWEKEIEQRLAQRRGVLRKLRDHTPRLGVRYFDLIADGCTGVSSLSGGNLEYVSRAENKWTKAQGTHVGHQVNESSSPVKKQYIDWKAHADGVNRFFALE